MLIEELLAQLNSAPEQVEFQAVIDTIDTHYNYQPTQFTNGDTINTAGSNAGSCKIFAFALLHKLNEAQTLACFGDYYRNDVLKHPEADDHANIRNFMQTGWAGIHFESNALSLKTT